MNQDDTTSSLGSIMVAFLAGAAIGAVIVALTTPKSGPELREDLNNLAARAKKKVGDLAGGVSEAWDDLKERTNLAVGDIKRGITEASTEVHR